MDSATAHWLAGLLEGEGTFLKAPPSEPNSPAIRVEMTDKDVIERVARIFCRAVIRNTPRHEDFKVPYATSIRGRDAVMIMLALRSLMGERRQAAIDQAVASARGARHGGPDLSWEQVAEIIASRQRREQRVRVKDLAEWYGVHPRTIYKITSGTYRKLPPIMIRPIQWDRAHADEWLAGLLEGEGCFTTKIQKSGKVRPVVRLRSTDRDVVLRAAEIMEASSVRKVTRDDERPGWRAIYEATVSCTKAEVLIARLYGRMGARRTKRMAEIHAAPSSGINENAGRLKSDQRL